jgi:hypothetical protein
MKRLAFAVLLTACEGVAPVDLHYVTSDDGGDAHVVFDAGAVEPADDDADPGSGPSGLCGCDFTAGESCCIPSGGRNAFCTTNGEGCAQQGGIALACNGVDSKTDSVCCWNGAAQAGSLTAYSSSCAHGPTSCTTSADCNGGACNIIPCPGGVSISACGVTPSCP